MLIVISFCSGKYFILRIQTSSYDRESPSPSDCCAALSHPGFCGQKLDRGKSAFGLTLNQS